MCGITTDVCLLFPALSAVQEGYDVYAVTDCSGCFNKQAETACILRMTQAGVKMTSWGSVASELLNDWSLPVGTELGKTLAEHLIALGYVANNMQGAHEELA
jgi:Isochorismatase family